MKKDIPIQKVTDIAIAIVPYDDEIWDVYLINLKPQPIHNVLVVSKGYGERDGKNIQTTSLRYFYDEIGGEFAAKIEPIQTELFDIANEFWISFQYEGFMFDRKYVFVGGSLREEYFTSIPILDMRGIMIK